MKPFNLRNSSQLLQYSISITTVLLVAGFCFIPEKILGYKVVALMLLVTVSALAMFLDIYPVLVAAILSALIWNFFFIPPLFTFHINDAEDLLLFLMYFLIALLNAVLTFKIREAENRARDKEEKGKSVKLYNTLLNSLSHEMRTPIATIIGTLDTLQENRVNLSTEQQNNLLKEIDIAGMRLNRQVENLLNTNRLEAGILQLRKDWCDANEIVFSTINKIANDTSARKIVFQPSMELPLFKLDEGIIEQVLYNLLHNAIQYTEEDVTIKVSVICRNEKFVISVADNGQGIPDSETQLIFNKFYRLPHSKAGGTGLGLSIVKGFVEAHGGNIIVENIEGGGACFTVTIPAETSFITNLKNE